MVRCELKSEATVEISVTRRELEARWRLVSHGVC